MTAPTCVPSPSELAKTAQKYQPSRDTCDTCKHRETSRRACGSQSFYTLHSCSLGKFQVELGATCDAWEKK